MPLSCQQPSWAQWGFTQALCTSLWLRAVNLGGLFSLSLWLCRRAILHLRRLPVSLSEPLAAGACKPPVRRCLGWFEHISPNPTALFSKGSSWSSATALISSINGDREIWWPDHAAPSSSLSHCKCCPCTSCWEAERSTKEAIPASERCAAPGSMLDIKAEELLIEFSSSSHVGPEEGAGAKAPEESKD